MRPTLLLLLVVVEAGALAVCRPDDGARGTPLPPPAAKEVAVSQPSQSNPVDKLPPPKGKSEGRVESKGGGPTEFEVKGTMAGLSGAVDVLPVDVKGFGGHVNVEIAVTEGRLRAYLADGNGYRFIEATPGQPASASGDMVYIQSYRVRLEAVGGDARGVSYRVWR